MTYYIHTRSLDPGMGYCDTGLEHRLLTNDSGHPYVTFSDRERAQEMCNDLNEQYPNADLVVLSQEPIPTTKHTPGPWEVGVGLQIFYKPRAKGFYLARVLNTPAGINQTTANARLIAAAPELLEALEAIATIGSRATTSHDTNCPCATCLLTDKARSAIAKATGERS